MSIHLLRRAKQHRVHFSRRKFRYSPPFAAARRSVNAVGNPLAQVRTAVVSQIASRRAVKYLLLNSSWCNPSTVVRTIITRGIYAA